MKWIMRDQVLSLLFSWTQKNIYTYSYHTKQKNKKFYHGKNFNHIII